MQGEGAAPTGGKERRDPFEWLVLAALAALGFSVLAGLFSRTVVKGGYVTGTDGFLVVDALQYLNWLRQSGEHFAAANLYDFAPLKYTFVHPGLIAAGLVNRLGASPVVAYALVKPFGIFALFAGAAAIVHRHLQRRDDRRAALVLALFYCAPASAIAGWTLGPAAQAKFQLDFAGGELWNGAYLWGYAYTAIAVGLVPLGLIAWERSRLGGNTRMALAAAGCALLSSWFQPWQGATLAGVVAIAELIRFRTEGRQVKQVIAGVGPMLVASALPLVYYFVLSKTDPAWELAGVANSLPRWPLWVLAAALLPLALPAAFTYGKGRWSTPGSVALRLWPLVALGVYFAPLGTFPFHAVQGMQISLSVLAFVAIRERLGERPLPTLATVLVLALLIVPGTAYRVQQMRDAVNAGLQPFFLNDDEHAALRFLDSSKEPGGVVTQNYMGSVIPAWTGRQTWLGAGSWTPDFEPRRQLLAALFAGKLGTEGARKLLVRPGAGYVLEDCRAEPAFFKQVEPFTEVVFRRGCVTVLRINGAPPLGAPQPPLPPVPAAPIGR